MKRHVLAAFAAAAVAASALPAHATPWQTFGPRAMGMGGAGVAIAQGPVASYYNPAGLGQLYNTSGLAVVAGGQADFLGSVIQGAKDVNQLVTDCKAGNAACTTANVNAALSNLGQPGNGAMGNVAGGLAVKIKKVVVFANEFVLMGATPQVDQVNTVAAAPGVNTIDKNQSKLLLRGAAFTEIGVGYGQEIGKTGLNLGVNLKGIIGKVGYSQLSIVSEDPAGGNLGKFNREAATSVQPGIDLGALWDLREMYPSLPWRPRLGFTARNINNPTFKQPAAATNSGDRNRYSLQGQMRTGVAVSPAKFWHLAADMDLTENNTPVDGYKSRFLSAGTEVNVFNREWINIPLRVGLMKNVSSGNSGLSYTGGFGLNFLHVNLDVGGMVSAKRVTIQSQGQDKKVPTNFGVAAQVAVLFGGSDAGARNQQ